MARPTNDPKTSAVRIRFNSESMIWLFRTSSRKGITVSELIRELVKKAMEESNE